MLIGKAVCPHFCVFVSIYCSIYLRLCAMHTLPFASAFVPQTSSAAEITQYHSELEQPLVKIVRLNMEMYLYECVPNL